MGRKAHEKPKKKESEAVTLKDTLNEDILHKLKQAQQQMEQEERRKIEETEKQKREERKRREKNKSFEELLNESSFDWKDFK
ncbi:MAG TPA: YqkE family protein [Bacillaceae bacterium]